MILGGYFDEETKLERIKSLEALMNEPGFWDDTAKANRVNQELTHLKKELKGYHDARGELEIILELLELEDESFNEEIKNNLEKLRSYGYKIIEPSVGHLACGYEGKGKLPRSEEIIDYVKVLVKERK